MNLGGDNLGNIEVKMKDIDIPALIENLLEIRKAILEGELAYQTAIKNVHPNYRYSAKNFIRYLKLRTFDLRKIQIRLSSLGLSSISHSERHVLANIENILHFLHLNQGAVFEGNYKLGEHPVNFRESQKVLKSNTKRLFKHKGHRNTSIMVTLASNAVNYQNVKDLMLSGMDVARINCSHDDQETWGRMVENIKRARLETKKKCSIYFDLSGPKLRTAELSTSKDHLLLFPGDTLYLYRGQIPNIADETGKKNMISCTISSILDDVKVNQEIWFDDGKIGGHIMQAYPDYMIIEIIKTKPKGSKLRAEKGINLPDTSLNMPSLTAEDLANLPFIIQYADIIGYSFVRKASDVQLLQNELKKLGKKDMGLVLKIENKEAFDNLPSLILQGMQSPSLGIMTARGDLSVELGPERLSEVQEQILWLCEAALIPNIWATQVLEGLAKKGIAARAEITDAAMAARSECVMLNKGDYILEAVKTLINILDRMEQHQYKKQGTLRLLKVAALFFDQDHK